jgi:hypothetical protein
MKNLMKTGLFALLLAFASCQNSSPAPQAAKQDKDSTTTKPAEPTVLPNVKCYEATILHQTCLGTVVQVKYDSIGCRAKVGCLGILDNVICLDPPNTAASGLFYEYIGKPIYFTASEILTIDYGTSGYDMTAFGAAKFRTVTPCPVPADSRDKCPFINQTEGSIFDRPNKYAKVSSYSFKNCESKK